mmetsp:Transcript_49617/g.121836  ORF Transcript_49617/g.121836 Transcript_49617/m.121836 type:complete len:254 (-) Transcript_49617:8-769(-)
MPEAVAPFVAVTMVLALIGAASAMVSAMEYVTELQHHYLLLAQLLAYIATLSLRGELVTHSQQYMLPLHMLLLPLSQLFGQMATPIPAPFLIIFAASMLVLVYHDYCLNVVDDNHIGAGHPTFGRVHAIVVTFAVAAIADAWPTWPWRDVANAWPWPAKPKCAVFLTLAALVALLVLAFTPHVRDIAHRGAGRLGGSGGGDRAHEHAADSSRGVRSTVSARAPRQRAGNARQRTVIAKRRGDGGAAADSKKEQ